VVDRTRFFHAAWLTITVGSRYYAQGADRTADGRGAAATLLFLDGLRSKQLHLRESNALDGRPVVSGVQVQAYSLT